MTGIWLGCEKTAQKNLQLFFPAWEGCYVEGGMKNHNF